MIRLIAQSALASLKIHCPAPSTSHIVQTVSVHCRAARHGYRSSAPSREVSSDLTCSWMELISSSVRLRSMER